jgi:hypothetical protein
LDYNKEKKAQKTKKRANKLIGLLPAQPGKNHPLTRDPFGPNPSKPKSKNGPDWAAFTYPWFGPV